MIIAPPALRTKQLEFRLRYRVRIIILNVRHRHGCEVLFGGVQCYLALRTEWMADSADSVVARARALALRARRGLPPVCLLVDNARQRCIAQSQETCKYLFLM